jgi:hypothetical protein
MVICALANAKLVVLSVGPQNQASTKNPCDYARTQVSGALFKILIGLVRAARGVY